MYIGAKEVIIQTLPVLPEHAVNAVCMGDFEEDIIINGKWWGLYVWNESMYKKLENKKTDIEVPSFAKLSDVSEFHCTEPFKFFNSYSDIMLFSEAVFDVTEAKLFDDPFENRASEYLLKALLSYFWKNAPEKHKIESLIDILWLSIDEYTILRKNGYKTKPCETTIEKTMLDLFLKEPKHPAIRPYIGFETAVSAGQSDSTPWINAVRNCLSRLAGYLDKTSNPETVEDFNISLKHSMKSNYKLYFLTNTKEV